MNTRHLGVRARNVLSLAAWLTLAVPACAKGPYVWVTDLPAGRNDAAETVVEPGDVLGVRVFNQDAMSTRARVRDDGKISVPFAGELAAAGKGPGVVAKEIEQRLKSYVVTPVVTVTLDEPRQPTVAVVGEVSHPGVYPIDASAGVLKALALAGGMTEFASHDDIYVLPRTGTARIRFSYRALTENETHATSFRLRAGDTVVVE